jgi:demethylmenaquinone methyltransferase/2-methoxy-6-polyprenyl-1,4-benzoquinol methylase
MTAARPLQKMFEAVPPRYDLINRLFTLGMDKKWRSRALLQCLAAQPSRVLDLCCGTGDMALGLASSQSSLTVLGLDYSQPMLNLAAHKAGELNMGNISWISGNAAQMPLGDASLDCVGISFAFRNLTYNNPLAGAHLAEVRRILRQGGRYVIVESSQPQNAIIRWFFRLYLRSVVFWLGWLISGNRGAYRYLSRSAAEYYDAREVRQMLLQAGFSDVNSCPLFFGAACIHVATK